MIARNLVPTAIGLAFVNAVPSKGKSPFTEHIINAVNKGVGMKSKPSVELNLSRKTASNLGLKGVF